MKTYIINLPHRTDRLLKVKQNFPNSEIIIAVDYSKLTEDDKCFWENKLKTPKNFIDSLGAIGCFASHYNTWSQITNSEDDYALVVEDDVKIIENVNFETELKNIIKSFPEDFDVLFIGGGEEEQKKKNFVNTGIYKFQFLNNINAFTTEAYFVSKKGAIKLIELVNSKKINSCNVDWYLHNLGKKNLINYYELYPLICFQLYNDSDIKKNV